MKRMGGFLLSAWMFSGTLAFASEDSLARAAHSRDRGAWEVQCAEQAVAQVDRTGTWWAFVVPIDHRPQWTKGLDKDALWLLAEISAPVWTLQQAEAQLKIDSGELPAIVEPPISMYWFPVAVLSLLLAIGVLALWAVGVPWGIPAPPDSLGAVEELFRGRQAMEREARVQWEAFQLQHQWKLSPSVRIKKYLSLLTKTEHEVVEAMLMGWSVEETARKMACTLPHIYNLRSSIRKKLDIDPKANLERQLRQLIQDSTDAPA